MSFDLKLLMGGSIASIEAALKAAYEQGVQDGIDRIAAMARAPSVAASTPAPTPTPAPSEITDVMVPAADITRLLKEREERTARRAPRGLVPKVMAAMMRDHPGKIIAEYEKLKDQYDSRVSKKSIGNELRRSEGKRYWRNAAGEWFPGPGNKEAGGDTQANSPASDHANERFDL